MEFRQLNTFIQVAKYQSFSKAAEHLGYSQSAVTVQIRMLEKELNTRLFDRMGKKILLTSQGQEFLECANTILYDVEKAKCSMESETAELKNPLELSNPFVFPSFLPLFIISVSIIRKWNYGSSQPLRRN